MQISQENIQIRVQFKLHARPASLSLGPERRAVTVGGVGPDCPSVGGRGGRGRGRGGCQRQGQWELGDGLEWPNGVFAVGKLGGNQNWVRISRNGIESEGRNCHCLSLRVWKTGVGT